MTFGTSLIYPTLIFGSFLSGSAVATTGSYAANVVECPSESIFRLSGTVTGKNQTLNSNEQSYVSSRNSVTETAWKAYFDSITSWNVSSIVSAEDFTFPRLAIAISGGGYRAALYGSGTLSGLDSRNASAVEAKTGGLLQASTYIAGLSGGSWMVGSFILSEANSIQDLVFGTSDSDGTNWGGWNVNYALLDPSTSTANNTVYDDNLFIGPTEKAESGFPITLADVWANGLAYHFLNGTTYSNFFDNSSHGAGILWSGITNLSSFQSYNIPFPIVVADVYSSNQNDSLIAYGDFVPLSNVIYSFTPYEFGSYDPSLAAFIETSYVGTSLNSGSFVNTSRCVNAFDQASFIMGTSSDLYNELANIPVGNTTEGEVAAWIDEIVEAINATVGFLPSYNPISAAYPNPFLGINPGAYQDSNSTYLNLIDGGLDGEVDPLLPLLVPAREIDVIIAIDGSSDTDENYSNGTSVVLTQQRSQLFPNGTFPFPPVPTSSDGWSSIQSRPVFFGCNSSISSGEPLLIYLPNSPPASGAGVTNFSTFQSSFTNEEAQSALDASQEAVTRTSDDNWSGCLACAVIERSRQRINATMSSTCSQCFTTYCWPNFTSTSNSSSSGNTGSSKSSSLPDFHQPTLFAMTLLTLTTLCLL